MNEEKLIKLALLDDSTHILAYIMNHLLGAFIEQEDDKAGELFNKWFKAIGKDAQELTLCTCPFEKLANKLANKYGFKEPWKQIGEFEWEYVGRLTVHVEEY